MFESIVTALVFAGLAYAGVGVLFALLFVTRGAARLDPDADGATWGFKVLILPGAAALWPLLAMRWVRGQGPPVEHTPHKVAAGEEA